MPKARLGVALLLPEPLATEVDGLRRALGDGALGRIPPHLTLVPPVNVREDRMGDALAVLRAAAATTRPLTLTLGPPETFLPVNPVVYLAVGGDVVGLRALRDAVFAEPLARPLTWPWVPHVTLADDIDPERARAGLLALGSYGVTARFERVHLLREGPGRVWEPVADAGFSRDAVVGRGGLALELAVSERLDAEAAAAAGPAAEPGLPFAVTARRDGIVVGAATGVTSGDEGELHHLLVLGGERRQGIGSHLLAAAVSLAAERGCRSLTSCPRGDVAGFLRHRGWSDDDGPVRHLRRDLG